MGFFSSKRHGVYKNVNGKAVLVEGSNPVSTTVTVAEDFPSDEIVVPSCWTPDEPILPVDEPAAIPKEKLDYVLKNGKVVPHEKPSEDATGAELLKDMLNTFSIKVEEKSAQKAKEVLDDTFEKLEPVETVEEVIAALRELDTKSKKVAEPKKSVPKKKVAPKKTTKEKT